MLKSRITYIITFACILILNLCFEELYAQQQEQDSIGKLRYPFQNSTGAPYLEAPIGLRKTYFEPMSNTYITEDRSGGLLMNTPKIVNLKQHSDNKLQLQFKKYFKSKIDEINYFKNKPRNGEISSLLPQYTINSDLFKILFGSGDIFYEIKGMAFLDIITPLYQHVDNPKISPAGRTIVNPFTLDAFMQINVSTKIGERVAFNLNYDTKSQFSFQDQFNLGLNFGNLGTGDIIEKIDIGNIGLKTNNELIISPQGLYGVRMDMRWGDTRVSTIVSEQKSVINQTSNQGTANVVEDMLNASDYDYNKHFFLSLFHEKQYDTVLSLIPLINTSMNINRIEVWVVENAIQGNGGSIDNVNRSIVSISSLGDSPNQPGLYNPKNDQGLPTQEQLAKESGIRDYSSSRNILLNKNLQEGRDFLVLQNARKLKVDEEYFLSPKLGFISLTRTLNENEVLAVAYEYTYLGKKYKVGEFSDDFNTNTKDLIMTKMLKSNETYLGTPYWKLMMKNIYTFSSARFSPEDFSLEIGYFDAKTSLPLNYWKEGALKNTHLLKVFDIDKISKSQVRSPDGLFDYIEGLTVRSEKNQIIFPRVEPFGNSLKKKLKNKADQEKYVFQNLYDSTQFNVRRNAITDKYSISIKYKSSQAISTGTGIVPGSKVIVKAGGSVLLEGIDYIINKASGEVEIINETLKASNQKIEILSENQNYFQNQTRTFIGLNIDHEINENFYVGGTYMRLIEKVNFSRNRIGSDPVDNSLWGLNLNYKTEFRKLNRYLKYFTFKKLSSPSLASLKWNYAYLSPTQSTSGLNDASSSYIDDFESAVRFVDLSTVSRWQISSTPHFMEDVPFTSSNITGIETGFHRGLFSIFNIDATFYQYNSYNGINASNVLSQNLTHRLYLRDLYPLKDLNNTQQLQTVNTLYLHFDPQKRGPYNYTPDLNTQAELNKPDQSWGGIMRSLDKQDFEKNNIQYIQFWVMDPFHSESNLDDLTDGKISFHLGLLSEDINRDGIKSFENGFPLTPADVDTLHSDFGISTNKKALKYVFEQNETDRAKQDIGLDGLNDSQERSYYSDYLNSLNPSARSIVENDPSADNYLSFKATIWNQNSASLIDRYQYFNNFENNSPVNINNPSNPASLILDPNAEDLNFDYTLQQKEAYFEYDFKVKSSELKIGRNFITDIKIEQTTNLKWFLVTIPLENFTQKYGDVKWQNIPSMRIVAKNFDKPITLRLAEMKLLSSDWVISSQDNQIPDISHAASIQVDKINIEQNATVPNIVLDADRKKVPYRLPPGTIQEQVNTNGQTINLNEGSLNLDFCNVEPNKRAAVFKKINSNLINYSTLNMYVHMHQHDNNSHPLFFFRFGSDMFQNYYEIQYRPTLTKTDQALPSKAEVWPSENNLNLLLEELVTLKLERNKASSSIEQEYTKSIGKKKYVVMGNPNLGNSTYFMVGVINDQTSSTCNQVWINDLKTQGFKNQGGWSTNADVKFNLSSLAQVDFTTDYTTVGYGGISQSIQQRALQTENNYSYSISSNLNSYLPEAVKINAPISILSNYKTITPQYNPIVPDATFLESIDYMTDGEKELLEDAYIEKQKYNVYSVQGFKIYRPKWMWNLGPIDIENFGASYTYSNSSTTNIKYEVNQKQNYAGGLKYSYYYNAKNYLPFSSLKWGPFFQWLNRFNFYLIPKNYNASLNFKRVFDEIKLRKVDPNGIDLPSSFNKILNLNWNYGLKYDITRSLKVSLDVKGTNIVNELPEYDADGNRVSQDSIDAFYENNLNKFGTPLQYHHTINANYNMPFDVIPYFTWINGNTSYIANYDWQSPNSELYDFIGNNLQNKTSIATNITFNLVRIYNSLKINPKKTKTFNLANSLKKAVTLVKNIRLSYTFENGNITPGYRPSVGAYGQSENYQTFAPGWKYLLGLEHDITKQGFENNWFTQNQNQQFIFTFSKSDIWKYSTSIRPADNFSISLSGTKNNTASEQFSLDQSADTYTKLFPRTTGSLSFSTLSLSNVFQDISTKNTPNYTNFRDNVGDPQSLNNSKYASIFLQSYTSQIGNDIFDMIPLPNWNANYNLEIENGFLNSIKFQNNYNSVFNAGGYYIDYDEENAPIHFSNLTISESFSPLLGMDIQIFDVHTISSQFNIQKNTAFSIENISITENLRKEINLGYTYTFEEIKIKKFWADASDFKGTLQWKNAFSYSEDVNTIRQVLEDNFQLLNGAGIWNFRTDLSLSLTDNLVVTAYYDHRINNPFISTLYYTSTIKGGFNFTYQF